MRSRLSSNFLYQLKTGTHTFLCITGDDQLTRTTISTENLKQIQLQYPPQPVAHRQKLVNYSHFPTYYIDANNRTFCIKSPGNNSTPISSREYLGSRYVFVKPLLYTTTLLVSHVIVTHL